MYEEGRRLRVLICGWRVVSVPRQLRCLACLPACWQSVSVSVNVSETDLRDEPVQRLQRIFGNKDQHVGVRVEVDN